MSLTRAACPLLVALLMISCARPRADTHAPAAATDAVAADTIPDEDVADPDADMQAPASGSPGAAQTISFADDAEPEPTTMVQAAPKRPPLPRFRLFGTRENDGPN